jgi:hypothetical protein
MWVIDDGPEPIDGFAIRLRLVRNHLPDCPQSEFENGVAAAFECRLYRGGMDELAYSPNRNAGNEMMSGWYVFPQNILRGPNGSFNYAIIFHDRSNARGPPTFQLRACDNSRFDTSCRRPHPRGDLWRLEGRETKRFRDIRRNRDAVTADNAYSQRR